MSLLRFCQRFSRQPAGLRHSRAVNEKFNPNCESLEDRNLLAVVGYLDDVTFLTGNEGYIRAAGHTPVRLTDADLVAASLANLDALIVALPEGPRPAALMANYPNVVNYVNNGGRLILHDWNPGQNNVADVVPGLDGTYFWYNYTPSLVVANPASPLVTGPSGTATDAMFSFAIWATHGFALGNTLPATVTRAFTTAGDPTADALFSYEFGRGYVVYNTIPVERFTNWVVWEPFRSNLLNVLLPNELNAALSFSNNRPPTADAGGMYSVLEGGEVVLDATRSSDPDQSADTLGYAWDLDGDGVFGETGVAAVRGDEAGARPAFSAAGLDGPVSVPLQLRVTDDEGLTSVSTASVTVVNVAPSVDAGADQTVTEGDRVTLNGLVSDPGQGDTHTYLWQVVSSNGQALANGTEQSFAFTPNDNGTYTVTLTVTDDDGAAAAATVLVTVNNAAPTASAGADQTVRAGSTVTLQGTVTDPGSNDTHTLSWQVVNEAGIVVADGTGPDLSFRVTRPGRYLATFTATDNDGSVGTSQTVVTVEAANLQVAIDGPRWVKRGKPYMLQLSVEGTGADKVRSWTIYWGDGTVETVCGNPGKVRHVFRPSRGHHWHGWHWQDFTIKAVAHTSHGDIVADNALRVLVGWRQGR